MALPSHPAVHFHLALPKWLAELAHAFTHVAWVSSWRRNCATFATGAGVRDAAKWPYLPSSDPSDETDLTGHGELPWGKLDAVLQWIAPDQPVAFVDDELVPQRWPYDRKADIDHSIEMIRVRPGPLLLLAPSREIGLTRDAVDLLCAFARNPHAGRFGGRGVHHLHSGRWTQWPWPLQAGQENPVTVLPEDEEDWEHERLDLLRERYIELNGADPARHDPGWCNWRD
ncbi:MAG: hypothetical protein F4090_06290 [Nitrospira sp. SB0672_bin_25]|nr:hypothetical protein [Nitrospira sp. SB0666_bin_27]MYJ54495.1 hypothetical protein [Nitrospira sp. SB0672_bin_25]